MFSCSWHKFLLILATKSALLAFFVRRKYCPGVRWSICSLKVSDIWNYMKFKRHFGKGEVSYQAMAGRKWLNKKSLKYFSSPQTILGWSIMLLYSIFICTPKLFLSLTNHCSIFVHYILSKERADPALRPFYVIFFPSRYRSFRSSSKLLTPPYKTQLCLHIGFPQTTSVCGRDSLRFLIEIDSDF